MNDFLLMLYIAWMLLGTVISIVGIIEERKFQRSSGVLFTVIICTCIMWATFFVYLY